MDIPPSLVEKYRRSARKREIDRKVQLTLRRERAWELAQRAAGVLKF